MKHAHDKDCIRRLAEQCEVSPWMADYRCEQLDRIAELEARLRHLKFEAEQQPGPKKT